MPEPQGYPLHPLRLQKGHVGVAVMLVFIGQKFLVGHRGQFLTSHFTHQSPPLESLAISGHQLPSSSVSSMATMRTPSIGCDGCADTGVSPRRAACTSGHRSAGMKVRTTSMMRPMSASVRARSMAPSSLRAISLSLRAASTSRTQTWLLLVDPANAHGE